METIPAVGARIGAVVLAAGLSRRMGRPKLVLPWRDTTVVGHVVSVLTGSELDEVVVVTGGAHAEVEAALQNTKAKTVFNPHYVQDDMVNSLAVGLRALEATVEAALVVLGDQPQIEASVVRAVIAEYRKAAARLVVPSYRMRRGHPWLIERSLWNEVFSLLPGLILRDFLNRRAAEIDYLEVHTPSVLADLDTPEDYDRERPEVT